jgi:peptide/nickel transport system permease protein
MWTFVLRRLLQLVPLLLAVVVLTFGLLKLAPGDYLTALADNPQISASTLDAMRHRFGLDQPWTVQLLLYLRNVVLHLDFGESFSRSTTAPWTARSRPWRSSASPCRRCSPGCCS